MDKLISADSLWMTIIHAMDYCEDILEFIEEEPEAVVRCKDCKWRGKLGCSVRIVDESDKPKDDDFCSWGERKEDAEAD